MNLMDLLSAIADHLTRTVTYTITVNAAASGPQTSPASSSSIVSLTLPVWLLLLVGMACAIVAYLLLRFAYRVLREMAQRVSEANETP